jgi:hypothetical protein
MTLNHFCDPDANAYPNPVTALDRTTKSWGKFERPWPIHDMCNGKAVVDFGLETELIARCECNCHDSNS